MNASAENEVSPFTVQAGERSPRLGMVVIGRNEGERLDRCLRSLMAAAAPIVYVDSGSTDGSVALAERLGATVVQLDVERPFTAARARNEGAACLRQKFPNIDFIQFVDGDCEVAAGWVHAAVTFLDQHPAVAATCGRRRERDPQRSVYNMLCDFEWNTPVGDAKAFGGDVLIRASAFFQVGGYREDFVAGEEPEMCVRLRAAGWRIWRLDAEMTLHDAAITRLGQWWNRSVRAGFAFAEGARLHGAPPERHWVRESRSALVWGALLPICIALSSAAIGPLGLWTLAVYPLQVSRLALRSPRRGTPAWWQALFLVAGKFPEAQGQIKSWFLHSRRRHAVLIEYK